MENTLFNLLLILNDSIEMTIEFPYIHYIFIINAEVFFLLQFLLHIYITLHSDDDKNNTKSVRNKKIHAAEILWRVIVCNDSCLLYEKYFI